MVKKRPITMKNVPPFSPQRHLIITPFIPSICTKQVLSSDVRYTNR